MMITEQWLLSRKACPAGINWWLEHNAISDPADLLRALSSRPSYQTWLIAQLTTVEERCDLALTMASSGKSKYLIKKYKETLGSEELGVLQAYCDTIFCRNHTKVEGYLDEFITYASIPERFLDRIIGQVISLVRIKCQKQTKSITQS